MKRSLGVVSTYLGNISRLFQLNSTLGSMRLCGSMTESLRFQCCRIRNQEYSGYVLKGCPAGTKPLKKCQSDQSDDDKKSNQRQDLSLLFSCF